MNGATLRSFCFEALLAVALSVVSMPSLAYGEQGWIRKRVVRADEILWPILEAREYFVEYHESGRRLRVQPSFDDLFCSWTWYQKTIVAMDSESLKENFDLDWERIQASSYYPGKSGTHRLKLSIQDRMNKHLSLIWVLLFIYQEEIEFNPRKTLSDRKDYLKALASLSHFRETHSKRAITLSDRSSQSFWSSLNQGSEKEVDGFKRYGSREEQSSSEENEVLSFRFREIQEKENQIFDALDCFAVKAEQATRATQKYSKEGGSSERPKYCPRMDGFAPGLTQELSEGLRGLDSDYDGLDWEFSSSLFSLDSASPSHTESADSLALDCSAMPIFPLKSQCSDSNSVDVFELPDTAWASDVLTPSGGAVTELGDVFLEF